MSSLPPDNYVKVDGDVSQWTFTEEQMPGQAGTFDVIVWPSNRMIVGHTYAVRFMDSSNPGEWTQKPRFVRETEGSYGYWSYSADHPNLVRDGLNFAVYELVDLSASDLA